MESAVTRLQTLFQKAESDLDYIQRRVEFEIMKNLPDDTAEEEDPAALLKELPLLKSRYKSLCAQMEQISREQKESMESIRAAVEKTMKITRELQQRAGLESLPLSAEEQTAAQQLNLQIGKEMEFSEQEVLEAWKSSTESFTDEKDEYESHCLKNSNPGRTGDCRTRQKRKC